jgi:Ca2+-binding RTX toxin-like protein
LFWILVRGRSPSSPAARTSGGRTGTADLPDGPCDVAPAAGILSALGDGADNTITVSRDAAGTILENGGAVAVSGGTAAVANTTLIQAFGQGGNDTISPDEAGGVLPRADRFSGAGNDALAGGSGNEERYGRAGNDTLPGGNIGDVPDGGPGQDVLNARSGDDTLIQGSGMRSESRAVSPPAPRRPG